jgi:hypothetical protein
MSVSDDGLFDRLPWVKEDISLWTINSFICKLKQLHAFKDTLKIEQTMLKIKCHLSHRLAVTLLTIGLSMITAPLSAQDAKAVVSDYFFKTTNQGSADMEELETFSAEIASLQGQNSFKLKTDNEVTPWYSRIYLRKDVDGKSEVKIEYYQDIDYSLMTSQFHYHGDVLKLRMGDMPVITKQYEPSEIPGWTAPLLVKHLSEKTKMNFQGEKIYPGDSVVCYELTARSGKFLYSLYFEKETHLLRHWKGHLKNSKDEPVVTTLSDYKMFRKFLLPATETQAKSGMIFHWSNLRKFETGRVPDDVFTITGKL